ncbi:MAG: NADPH:quinone oxidoreductase family protein, partial [Alphaproteobacteria bacterium]
PGHGGYATHVLAPRPVVIPIPDEMPFDEAAGFLFTYGTTYYALRDRGRLAEGETLLVLGAAGGVGSAAIEIGKAMGARVIAAVSSDEKAAFCRELGADETVVYPRELDREGQKALSAEFKRVAGPGLIDVVYDAVGGPYAEPALRALGWNGRFLVIGFPAGIPKIPLNLTLLKSCQIIGVFWGAFARDFPEQHAAYMGELFELYRAGKVRPRITERLPLEKAAEALRLIESRKARGKIVLTVDE